MEVSGIARIFRGISAVRGAVKGAALAAVWRRFSEGARPGAPGGKSKPLDGLDVWPALSAGQPTGRDEVVYNIEPFRAAVRKGDWKLV